MNKFFNDCKLIGIYVTKKLIEYTTLLLLSISLCIANYYYKQGWDFIALKIA
jgi:hypothetical protein